MDFNLEDVEGFDKIQVATEPDKADDGKKKKSLPNVTLNDKKKQDIADWINDCESITEAIKITGLDIAAIGNLSKEECDSINSEANIILEKCLKQDANLANKPPIKKIDPKSSEVKMAPSKTEKASDARKKIPGVIAKIFKDGGYGFINDTDWNEYFFHLSQLRWIKFEEIHIDLPVIFDIQKLPHDGEAGVAHNIHHAEEVSAEISAKNTETETKIEEEGEEDMTADPVSEPLPKSKVKKKRGPKNIELTKNAKKTIADWINGCKTRNEAAKYTGLGISTLRALSRQENKYMRVANYDMFKKLLKQEAKPMDDTPVKEIESIPAQASTPPVTNEMEECQTADTNLDKNTNTSNDNQSNEPTTEFRIMGEIDDLLSKIDSPETRKRILNYMTKKWKGK